MDFCLACGLPLDLKLNKKWNRQHPDFCNDKCKARHERAMRPRNRPKYGATGYIYPLEK